MLLKPPMLHICLLDAFSVLMLSVVVAYFIHDFYADRRDAAIRRLTDIARN